MDLPYRIQHTRVVQTCFAVVWAKIMKLFTKLKLWHCNPKSVPLRGMHTSFSNNFTLERQDPNFLWPFHSLQALRWKSTWNSSNNQYNVLNHIKSVIGTIQGLLCGRWIGSYLAGIQALKLLPRPCFHLKLPRSRSQVPLGAVWPGRGGRSSTLS